MSKCAKTTDLTQDTEGVAESVTSGILLALQHCQNVFLWDKWNCTNVEFHRLTKSTATKEAAFSKAILAAAVVHSITRDCSRGDIQDCSCKPVRNELRGYNSNHRKNIQSVTDSTLDEANDSNSIKDWSWSGCSDDTSFGNLVAKDYITFEDDVFGSVGKHNYRVGREIVYQTMIKRCRCHGVSGSCSTKTCWMQVAPFKDVARKLKEKYNKAVRLSQDNVEAAVALSNSIKNDKKYLPAPEYALVYLEQSPDYCILNATNGWPGTKGRTCSKTLSEFTSVSERKSCRNLCRQCGHRVKKETRTVKKSCNCNFQWCCSVKCDICLEKVERHYCV
ncbi:protein Wnt-8b-like isoform X2 [Sitophilus oryzae]|uniref:Protein Wnt n=1 Tax=Sitophilus oryzae TaxID=7048 RepID=A0A6J2YWB1_SITOR|nr:protein Wnt-8b-like isoform X2 [Sitophilus oryzae]